MSLLNLIKLYEKNKEHKDDYKYNINNKNILNDDFKNKNEIENKYVDELVVKGYGIYRNIPCTGLYNIKYRDNLLT